MRTGSIKIVEVIKQGTKNLVECDDCGSTLKYSASDISKVYSPPRGPYEMEGCNYYYIRCPCNNKISVSVSSGLVRKIEENEKARERADFDL